MRAPGAGSFPYADAVPALASLALGDGIVPAVDHARLVEAAAYHRLGAHLLVAVREGRAAVAPALLAELERHEWGLVLRSALHLTALPGLAAAIRGRCQAAPIVLKGPDAASLYPRRSLRAFGDLDLLVPREVLPAAVAAVEALGYEPLVELRPGFGALHGHDVRLVRRTERGDIGVELHWRVGDDRCSAALDHPHLVRAALAPDGATGALCPGPADRLLVFAVHFLSDRKRRLVWANDLRLAALDAPEDAWDEAFARADDLPWVLHRALDHVEEVFGPVRPRPRPAGPPPPFGPIRAIEAWGAPAALHLGRLAQLRWHERAIYVVQVALPTRAGLEGTVGGDGATGHRLVLRHVARAVRSVRAGR